jgi:hypothetical protein
MLLCVVRDRRALVVARQPVPVAGGQPVNRGWSGLREVDAGRYDPDALGT